MKKSFFIILILIITSCSKKQTEIPANVLTHDQMVSILIDVHVLEAKVKKLYLHKDSSVQIYNHFEQQIYDKHDITRDQYQESLQFYIEELDEYKSIYDEVVDSLLSRQTRKIYR